MLGRVFLCYANAEPSGEKTDKQRKHLQYLREEHKKVKGLFKAQHDVGQVNFESLRDAKSRQEVSDVLTDPYCKDLLIFGFSGHSSGKHFMLEDEHIRSEGLALLLAKSRCPDMKLVFLNGCLTQRSIAFFEQSEVPMIISTNTFIGDEDAKKFAVRFFTELVSNKKTLLQAYEDTVSFITLNRQITGPKTRCYKTTPSPVGNSQITSWELAYREEIFLGWKLEMGKHLPIKTRRLLEEINISFSNLEQFFARGIAEFVHCDTLLGLLLRLDGLSEQSTSWTLDQYRISQRITETRENVYTYLEATSSNNQWMKGSTGKEIARNINLLRNHLIER